MTARRPRQVIFRGRHAAAGLIFEPPPPEHDRRRRVRRWWRPGSTVYRLDDGAYFLIWPEPTPIHADATPATVVVRGEDGWTTAPPVPQTASSPSTPSLVLHRCRHGRMESIALAEVEVVDPAAWLNLGSLDVVSVESLGARPAPVALAPAPRRIDLAVAAGVTAADRVRQETVRSALVERRPATADHVPGVETPAWRRWLFERLRWLHHRLKAPSAPAAGGGRPGRPAGEPVGPQGSRHPRRPWWRSPFDRLAQWIAQYGFQWALGRWHQRYLDRLLGMFESGHLDEALRHAIPLGGESRASRVAWQTPEPRHSLEWQPPRRDPAAGLLAAPDAWTSLERAYRRSVDRLVADRRLKEAAFVLAELLNKKEEAVAMLEREGETRLAAELADTAELAPSLRVRLWAKAGDADRALRLARRYNAFADALAGVSDARVRRTLTALWAAHRAETGDYAGAVDLVWGPRQEVPDDDPTSTSAEVLGRPLRAAVQTWIEAALALGGTQSVRVFARHLRRSPEAFADVRERVERVLEDPSSDGTYARSVMAESFRSAADVPGVQVLARALVRQLILDGLPTTGARRHLDQLLGVAGDPVLRADVPSLVGSIPLSDGESKWAARAQDRGQAAVYDAVRLPSGRLLLALGEAGTLLSTTDGRPLAHLKVPATSLVPSESGHRALALMPRGSVVQIHRLDLVRWRAATWCEQPLGPYASTFDGWRWFAAIDRPDRVAMVDVTSKSPQIEWTTPADELQRIEYHPHRLALLAADFIEVFDTTRLRLLERNPLELPLGHQVSSFGLIHVSDLTADGRVLLLERGAQVLLPDDPESPVAAVWRAHERPGHKERLVSIPVTGEIAAARRFDDQLVVALREDHGVTVSGFEWSTPDPWLELQLEGATHAGIRAFERYWVVFDDVGRVTVVDPSRRTTEQRIRVRL